MRTPVRKPALDAITDQSLAAVAEYRGDVRPVIAGTAAEMAALLAEQFPGDRAAAGRVTMAIAQAVAAMTWDLTEAQHARISDMTDILALAAEQLTREARDG